MLYPARCGVCDRVGASPCDACIALLRRADGRVALPGLSSCVPLLRYEDAGKTLIASLKFRRSRSMVRWLAAALEPAARDVDAEVVTWIPASRVGGRRRGFDQAEVIARALARRLDVPCIELLGRKGRSQTGLGRAQRLAGPRLSAKRRLNGGKVILVDDVLTTGATISAAALELRRCGAREVHGLIVARA